MGKLIPGFCATHRTGKRAYHAILVPNTAIGNDQSQKNVLVLDKDNKVVARPVTLGALSGGLRSITSGIRADDRVVQVGRAVGPARCFGDADRNNYSCEGCGIFLDPGEQIAAKAGASEQSANASPGVYTERTSSGDVGQ